MRTPDVDESGCTCGEGEEAVDVSEARAISLDSRDALADVPAGLDIDDGRDGW